MRDLIKTCFIDLEDDVWRTLSDPPHGPVLHLHRRHLQRVLQQRPQCVRLGVARWAHVPKEHLEVRTKPSLFFSLEISAQWLLFVYFLCLYFVLLPPVPQSWLEAPSWPSIPLSLGPSRALTRLVLIRYGPPLPFLRPSAALWPTVSGFDSVAPAPSLCLLLHRFGVWPITSSRF